MQDISTLLSKYQLLLMDCPYNTINQDQTIDLLGRIARFKVRSYRASYAYGILPFDGVDLVGTHFLLCEKVNGHLEPVVGLKIITHLQCRKFNLNFPIYGFFGAPETDAHKAAIDEILKQADLKNEAVVYFGSWTMRPEVRADAELSKICREITETSSVFSQEYFGFKTAVTAAMRRFKVHEVHKHVGMEPLHRNGVDLPVFHSKMMMGDPCSISVLHAKNLSKEVRALAEIYRPLWENRLEIKSVDDSVEILKAA